MWLTLDSETRFDSQTDDVEPSLLSQTLKLGRVRGDILTPVEDNVAVEEPLEIRLVFGPRDARRSKAITVTMRTPGNDEELAAGFLLTEGILTSSTDILSIRSLSIAVGAGDHVHPVLGDTRTANTVIIEIAEDVVISPPTLERNVYMTSSCGVFGKGSLLVLRSVCPPRSAHSIRIDAGILHALPARLCETQETFNSTGGLHGAGLFTTDGQLELLREDVGRHNAVDRLLGARFLADRVPLRDRILLLSGRASFELLQKAVMASISVVAAVGAPSSLAVRVATEFNLTLIGFLRDRRFNVYSGDDRLNGLIPTATNIDLATVPLLSAEPECASARITNHEAQIGC